MNLWQKLDSLPPVAIRLLAKNEDGSAMSDQEIVDQTGSRITLADVKWLSFLPDWDNVPVRKARDFLRGCRCDLTDTARVRTINRYLKRDPKFTHLRKDPNFPEFRAMLQVFLSTLTQ